MKKVRSSTEIKYFNVMNELITAQQKEHLKEFVEITEIDSRIKYKKDFMSYGLSETEFIYPDEDMVSILNNKTIPGVKYRIAKGFEELNGFTSWKYYSYINGSFESGYLQRVFNDSGRQIAVATFNEDGQITDEVFKVFHLNGRVFLDEETQEEEFDFEDWHSINFDFKSGSLEIEVVWNGMSEIDTLDTFLADWEGGMPYLTQDVIDYFSNKLPLIPPVSF